MIIIRIIINRYALTRMFDVNGKFTDYYLGKPITGGLFFHRIIGGFNGILDVKDFFMEGI